MSKIITYITNALQGVERYLGENKLIVVSFALLLVWWLAEKKVVEQKGRNLLIYAVTMSVLLFCPITAVAILIYQTAYYDYEWAWSLVPLTAALAYGITLLLHYGLEKKKRIWGILAVAGVLCLCGNQGTPRTVDSTESVARVNTTEILQCIGDLGMEEKTVLWAPQEIMQEVRRQDGKILLIYGRDMWDGKAGAYDYEAYSVELTDAYIWLEAMVEQGKEVDMLVDASYYFPILCEEQDLDAERENHLRAVLEAGANLMVLPNLAAEHIEESVLMIAKDMQLEVRNTYTEEYTIYLFE